jgi:murein DD-endopeptidase MepM/ murein hydrolase activator NlpD
MQWRVWLVLVLSLILTGCTQQAQPEANSPETAQETVTLEGEGDTVVSEPSIKQLQLVYKRVEFADFDEVFRFSAEVPTAWEVEYVSSIRSLSVYDPSYQAESQSNQSRFFIRFFEANDFLTLSTVTIFAAKDTTVGQHAAVEYDIEKKSGVPDFAAQPSWRNQRHQLTDVRFSERNPSLFYVFAYAPGVPKDDFERFLHSLIFHNDEASFVSPIDQPDKRVIKKPFGIKIDPATSPVQPERFSGFHTGTDFEAFASEADTEVSVRAFCGGQVLTKRTVSGYGGVLVQTCQIDDEIITALYGHLDIGSISVASGQYLSPGDVIGYLGEGESTETDGERKHLHFSLHKGASLELRGYTASENNLPNWYDPIKFIL